MIKRAFRCDVCHHEITLICDTDDQRPQNWVIFNGAMICDGHRTIVINHHHAHRKPARVRLSGQLNGSGQP